MAYLSGWCGTGRHDVCSPVVRNGALASQRYTICRCACHDDKEATLQDVLAVTGDWGVATPINTSRAELERYLDQVNAIARPVNQDMNDD